MKLLAVLIVFIIPFVAQAIDRIELENGEIYQGRLNGMTAGYVILSQTSAGGSIERRYTPEQIKKLHFPDTAIKTQAQELLSDGEFEKAATLYEGLIWQRLPYLGILDEADEQLFAQLIQSYVKTGRSAEASERIRLWKPRLKSAAITEQLDEFAMLAAWNSGNHASALLLAHRWIDQGKSATTTCLAWRIIAHNHWMNGHVEDTLWTSLQPIAFSQIYTPRQIEYCYALAILATHRRGNTAHSEQLAAEMRERNLSWPIELPTLSESAPIPQDSTEQSYSPLNSDSPKINIDQFSKLLGQP